MKKIKYPFIYIFRKILHYFWCFHKPIVKKNIRFQDIHKGETCLIFGNGASLKFYDFNVLPKIPVIGCNYAPIDQRFKGVDFRYWLLTDSYGLYKRFFHLESLSFPENFIIARGQRLFCENKDKIIFTSLTSMYGKKSDIGEVVYFHHFGDRLGLNYDLAGVFSVCMGSLEAMIGVAKYMGFAKAILLGCDYLGIPQMEGHFYSDALPFWGETNHSYGNRMQEVAKGIEILVICPKSVTSPYFSSVSYEEYFGSKERYQENSEFIDADYLQLLRYAASKKLIYM